MPIDSPVEQSERSFRSRERAPVKPLRRKLPRVLLFAGAGIVAILCGTALFYYLQLTRIVDQRLAEGPFPDSINILATPHVVRTGEAIGKVELVNLLRQDGYSSSQKSPAGSFEELSSSVQIFPDRASGETGSVIVSFDKGRISSIVSAKGTQPLKEYALKPTLLANVSESREKRRPVHFASIPPSLVHAVVSVEDKRFFNHGGFDAGRMVKAAYVDMREGRKREGASTLTMQLARSLWLDREKKWQRKIAEVLITAHLEHKLTKQQIFEDYANQIYLGQSGTYSIHGFGEGARAFFGKDLSQIDTAEAAMLAGVIQGPSYYNPFQNPERALQRRNLVLAMMFRNHYLEEADYRKALAEPLGLTPSQEREWDSSYFLGLMRSELRSRFGEEAVHNRSVYSTLDPELQKAAEAAIRSGMEKVDRQLRRRRDHAGIPAGQPQVALIALDPRNGEIRALAGGRDYEASQLNHVLSGRQPGSVFKPFVYAAAISTGLEGGAQFFTPATILKDEPTTFRNGYQPKDFHGDFMGDVTLRTALAHSLNVATVSLAEQVGFGKVVALARRSGFNDKVQPTPAVALGAYEATPLEVSEAYTVFANRGMAVRPTTIREMRAQDGSLLYRHRADARQVLDPRVAYLMVNLMEEVLRTGTGAGVRSLGFTQPAAGKTGTSRDGWFAGFTTELLCVVWVGFDDNRDLGLEGARSALPIWAAFMRSAAQLPAYSQARAFDRPAGITVASICPESGKLASPSCLLDRTEVFIAGTEPQEMCDLPMHGVSMTASDGHF